MIVANTIGATLAVITHMNVDFKFGVLNYVVGTNEMHRWHHSEKIEEAKNFSVIMLWDQLFGTYVNPKGRARPDRLGLFNELYFPIQSFWGQLLIPFTWKRWKAKQMLAQQGARNIVPASEGPFPKLNPEFVVRARPELIVVSAGEVAGLRQRPGWGAIPAVQQGRICALSPTDMDAMSRPGPRLPDAARVLASCLRKAWGTGAERSP